jgi:hypothetical protein
MINPYVLQLLAMRQRMNQYGSTAMDFPADDIYARRPWRAVIEPIPNHDPNFPVPVEPIPNYDPAAERRFALLNNASRAMDYPQNATYGMQPWNAPPSPVEPYGGMPVTMNPGGDLSPVVGAPQVAAPEFDEAGAQRRARRAGLGALGVALLAGAGKGDYAGSLAEGLAAMAATRQQRFEGERSQFRQDSQERLAREAYERQNRLTQAQIENYEADNERAQQAAEAQAEARQAEVVRQQEIVEALPPGEQRDRLARLIGAPPDDFRRYYWEITAPAKPKEPDRMQVQGDVLEFPEAGGAPRVVYSAPPEPSSRMSTEDAVARAAAIAEAVETVRQRHGKGLPTQEQLHDNISAEENRLYNEWLTGRLRGVGKEVEDIQLLEEWSKKKLPGIPVKKGPNEMFIRLKDGSKITEAEFYRRKFRKQAEVAARERQKAARQQRSDDLNYYMDENGNLLP